MGEKKNRETNVNENTTVQNHQDKTKVEREVYGNTGLFKKARRISHTQPNLTPKGARNRII